LHFVLVTAVVAELHLLQEMEVDLQEPTLVIQVFTTVVPAVMLEILDPLVVAEEVARRRTSKVIAEPLLLLQAVEVVVLVVQMLETILLETQAAQEGLPVVPVEMEPEELAVYHISMTHLVAVVVAVVLLVVAGELFMKA
jgi:hypothetical protein